MLPIVVLDLAGDTLLDQHFEKDATVKEVKEQLTNLLSVPRARQNLFVGAEVLGNAQLLAELPEPRMITFVCCPADWEQTLREHNVPSEFWPILRSKRVLAGFRRTTKWEECDMEQRLEETDVDLADALGSGRLNGGIGWTVELDGGSRFVYNPPLPRYRAGFDDNTAALIDSGLTRADYPNAPQSGMFDKEAWWVIPLVPPPRRTVGAAVAAAAAAAFGGRGAAAADNGAEAVPPSADAEEVAAAAGSGGPQSAASSRVTSKESNRARRAGEAAGGGVAAQANGPLGRVSTWLQRARS